MAYLQQPVLPSRPAVIASLLLAAGGMWDPLCGYPLRLHAVLCTCISGASSLWQLGSRFCPLHLCAAFHCSPLALSGPSAAQHAAAAGMPLLRSEPWHPKAVADSACENARAARLRLEQLGGGQLLVCRTFVQKLQKVQEVWEVAGLLSSLRMGRLHCLRRTSTGSSGGSNGKPWLLDLWTVPDCHALHGAGR